MPKIFGSSLLGILLASLALYMLGFIWYGILFEDLWISLSGISKEAAQTNMESMGAMGFVWGIIITLAQVLGLAYILNHANAARLGTCVKIGAIIATLIALPVMAYNVLYGGSSAKLLGLDYAHLLIGYAIACAILSLFRRRGALASEA
ncbi:MAG: DUF1761 domain-containing protein [Robiginitomaculum sp.]